ncbi:hypothetical protein [Nocardia abscessus]|uniref:hypothetical protein n=1 Tax=Nocardia abscessus TaxID=120957 RepID=UPI00245657A9|nr:hypothetical protein [Nocardia abscessus]
MLLAVATDDLGDHVEQLGRHGHDAFTIALGRCDDQQRDYFTVRALILTDAEVTQLAQLLDPHPGRPQRLDDRPLPERQILRAGEFYEFTGGTVDRADRRAVVALILRRGARPGHPGHHEVLPQTDLSRRVQELAQPVPFVVDVLHQDRQQRLAGSGPVGHAFSNPAAALVGPA